MASSAVATTIVAYVGIGSNLCDPAAQVLRAFEALSRIPGARLLGRSALYLTTPVGPQDQPDYVNAAACLETTLSAPALLVQMQAIERSQGRVRDGTRWGPRTLDLDLLLYGEASIELPGLRVPHPEIANRTFVLVPLADVAPESLFVPGHGSLGGLLRRCPPLGITRLDRGPGAGCDVAGRLAESAHTP